MLDITKKLPSDYERLTLSSKNYLPPVPLPKNGDGWTSKARSVTIGLSKKVPYVGSILSFVIQSFWSEGKADIWSQVSANVEKMIDLKVLEFEINRDGAELAAIKADIISYIMAKNTSEKAMKLTILVSTCNELYHKLVRSINKVQLVPFTIAFSILHLSILKERVEFGKDLYGEDDEAWSFELKKQLDDYSRFLKEQVPALKQWRADQIVYSEETSGLIIKNTVVTIHDKFLDDKVKRDYAWTARAGGLKNGFMKIKEYWVSAWAAQFIDSYSPYFYMNNLIPGFENELPIVDPDFQKVIIGPFCPGVKYDMPVDKPANDTQQSGVIKEIVFNYGDNMDSFQVNFTDHDGIRPTKIGGDKTKTVKVDPNKKVKALRFYYYPGYIRSSLASISFAYDDGTESERVRDRYLDKQQYIEVPVLNDYYISNIKAAREPGSSTADFSYWFWVEMTFKPGMPVVD